MKLENIKLNKLKIYGKNPRNNDDAVKYVANSINKYGFLVPIVIDKNNNIVCGHTRYKASQKLKLKEVPCIRAEDLTETQIKAFRIEDNKTSEKSTWDNDLLKDELSELKNLGINLEDLGFLDFELNNLFDNNLDNFIDDLEENNFLNENLPNAFFSMTFVFPKDKEEIIKKFISENGKESIVNEIIKFIEDVERSA